MVHDHLRWPYKCWVLIGRHADDVQINREMREVERWNDPAAEFITVCARPMTLCFLIRTPCRATTDQPEKKEERT